MTHVVRILTLMLTLACATAWAEPARAARLAAVTGEAGQDEARNASAFRLDGQTALTVNYTIGKKADACRAQVRIYREQQNGQWLVVNNVFTTQATSRGKREITLPAGNYRIEVVATQASYDVTVDN